MNYLCIPKIICTFAAAFDDVSTSDEGGRHPKDV